MFRIYQYRSGKLLIHTFLWLAYLLLLMGKDGWLNLQRASFTNSLPYWLSCVLAFYGLAYFVIPQTLYKQRYLLFGLYLLLSILVYLLVDYAASWLYFKLFTVQNPYTLQYYRN